MNKKYFTILIHLSGWIAFFVFPFVLVNFPADPNLAAFKDVRPAGARPPMLPFFLINNTLFILLFYFNLFYLLPNIYFRQKKLTYFLAMFGLLMLSVYLPSYIKSILVQPPHFVINGNVRRPFRNMDRTFGFLHFLIIWFLSSIICMAQRYRKMEQRNKEMKVEKLDSELSYLKAQINPHFLFNTLNNIYSLSICESEQTPEAILKLSYIMRYVTQDAEAEKVPLDKEIEYLENYIDLQQLRSNNNLSVQFAVTGNTGNKMIAPLLLINFIENAFKHGVSNHVPCFVESNINIEQQQLTMTVSNKKITGINTEHIATGTNNTKRRLALQYPGKHTLTIDETNDIYKITLILNLI